MAGVPWPGDERGRHVESVRDDLVSVGAGPVDEALEEVAVGAPDVEEVAIAVDRRGDRAAQPLPAVGITAEATAAAGILGGEVHRFQLAPPVVHPVSLSAQPTAASAIETWVAEAVTSSPKRRPG